MFFLILATRVAAQVEGNSPSIAVGLECYPAPTVKYFKTHKKPFNVVTGEEISYKMKGLKGAAWDWKLGVGGCATAADVAAFDHYWQLGLDPGAVYKSKGK